MSARHRLLAALASLLLAALLVRPGAAETLVVDLSTDTIPIASDFSGTSIALFGVVERDAQTVARGGAYEIAVIVRGPPNDVLVQRKERRFGIWMNVEGERFRRVPSFSGLFTTPEPGSQLEGLLKEADAPQSGNAKPLEGERALLFQAYASNLAGNELYVRDIGGVEMLTDRFFRTLIPLPDVAPDGRYSVEVLLFVGGVQLDRNEMSFVVEKFGLEQKVFAMSNEQPLLYGLLVVALALVTGYVGGVVFRRN